MREKMIVLYHELARQATKLSAYRPEWKTCIDETLYTLQAIAYTGTTEQFREEAKKLSSLAEVLQWQLSHNNKRIEA